MTKRHEMARGARVLISIAAAAFVAAACSTSSSASSGSAQGAGKPPSSPSGVIRIAAADSASTLDFMATTNGSTLEITNEVVEPLFALDNTWQPQPLLVSKTVESPDAKSYKFTLRNVNFQNGQPLTSADVVASMQRWIKTDSRAKKWFVGLTSLTATDTHTVDFEFSQPFGVLTNYLAAPSSAIIPAADAEAAGDGTLQPSQLIGTGPFKLASWNPGVKVVLKRYSGYQSPSGSPSGYAGTKKAYVNELDFIPVADASARLAGLQAGEYEYAESIPGDQESVLKGSGFLEAPRVVGPVTAFLNAHSQILTPAVREAILSSIDMGSVGKALGPSDLWSLSPALAPPGGALASSAGTANWNKPNVANAKQLLASAGYNGAELTMITTSSPATYAMAIVLQQDLQNIGMKVKLQEMETAAMQARRAGATGWDIAMGQLNRAADGTQQSALYCGNTNGGYCSDQMNSLISQYQQATTPTAQKSAHDKIQELYYQDLPFIMGPDLSDLAGVSPKLKGFTPTGLPLPHFWNSWLNS